MNYEEIKNIKEKIEPYLFQMDSVKGVGIGKDRDGELCIMVYVVDDVIFPPTFDGVKIIRKYIADDIATF